MTSLGIDVGTSNVKAVLVDDEGRVLASAVEPLTWSTGSGVAELDGRALWEAVPAALAALGRHQTQAMAAVEAIGVCGQYSSTVPVDRDRRPLAPMRLYLDQRGTQHCQAILERRPDSLSTWMQRHPIPPIGGGLALGHLLAFQHDEPAVHARTTAYLEPVDYVTARMTGRITATQGSMFATQLIDNRSLDRRHYDPELIEASGVDAARLPPLIGASDPVGPVLPELADRVGIPPTATVTAGMTDSHAAALATGAARQGRMGVAVGTTSVLLTTTDHLHADFDHEVLAMPGVGPGGYLVWAENGLAGRAVEHVLDRFVHPNDVLGDHRVDDRFGGFEEALARSGAGAGGVRFLPWLSGSMAPQADGAMRGGFVGVSLETTRVDLVRAAAEGVAHNLRWLLDPVEAFAGQQTEELVLVGGAARSPRWCQLLADVLAHPVLTVAHPALAGARAVAAWAADQDPVGETTGRYEPDPATTTIHDEAQGQFCAAFEALRPLRLGARRRPVRPDVATTGSVDS